MKKEEFVKARKILGKTQKQMSELLGTSLKAVHSYEQGWRQVPVHVERQVYFLLSRKRGREHSKKTCWVINQCPKEKKLQCPAWEFRAGKLCWFINGTICQGEPHKNWNEKMKICRECDVLLSQVNLGN